MATDFPVNLQSAESSRDMLNFIRMYCPWAVKWKLYYRTIVYLDAARRVFAPAAAMAQTLDLNALFPNNTFPANVDLRAGAKLKLLEECSGTGILSLDAELGGTFDTGADPNGLVTSSDVFTGSGLGYRNTPAAAEYDDQYEAAFEPSLTLTSTGANLDVADLTGAIQVLIPWSPLERFN